MVLHYRQDHFSSGIMITKDFQYPISSCFKSYKRQEWLKHYTWEFIFNVDIAFIASLRNGRRSDYSDFQESNLPTFSLNSFLCAAAKYLFIWIA